MLTLALALPREVLAVARRGGQRAARVVEAAPRLVVSLGQLRDTTQQLEQLATYIAAELPEIVYQLEAMRAQLDRIERHLGTEAAPETRINPAPPRIDRQPPSGDAG